VAKVKQRRNDFVVRELVKLPRANGPYAIYLLEKSGIGTSEALQVLLREWNLPFSNAAYAGRKDRHAVTIQTVTILNGPQTDFAHEDFSIRYEGQSPMPVSAKHLLANEFQIRLRDLPASSAENMLNMLQVPQVSVPNYFDSQRFGSVTTEDEFVAAPWCMGNYEQALYFALAAPTRHDSPHEKEQKQLLRDHWKDWQTCKDLLERSNRRSVITYLVDHPTGWKKAAALIQRDMRSLYVSALQSRLWNETCALWLQEQFPDATWQETSEVTGEIVWPRSLLKPSESSDDSVRESCNPESGECLVTVPLPSSRPTKWNPRVKRILAEVCERYGLSIHKLRFSHPRDVFFSRANRRLFLEPQSVRASIGNDELSDSQDRKVLDLEMRLLPGQYATTLLRSLEQMRV
jgi:tRNA pseudouridine13 synthase